MKCLEDSSIFNNWGPGYLAGYLKAINKQLESNENFDSWFQYHNEKLYELKQDTLFIPVYTQTKEAIWKAAYYTDSTFSEAGLRECYPYPIKFITNDELDRRITTSGKEVKYLLLTIDGSDKYIDIYSSTSGLIYNRMTYMSWTIKNLDMARIAEVIENLKISDK
jgi:hypothetical protein